MLHLLPDGERRYRLIDGDGHEVGWIRGRAALFNGINQMTTIPVQLLDIEAHRVRGVYA